MLLTVISACSDNATVTNPPTPRGFPTSASHRVTQGFSGEALLALMDEVNAQAESRGARYRVAYAEWVAPRESGEAGGELVARNVGNKRLADDFVPFDPRRADWSGPVTGASDDITFAIDQTGDATPVFGGVSAAAATAAIRRAMDTWRSVRCAPGVGLTERSAGGQDLGFVAALVSGGQVGSTVVAGDVMHAGWRDLNFAGGVLGVTFTFIFVDENDDPTDIDGNGREDVAFREIYYDPSWEWKINDDIDIESVALHEAGHALSQDHFGNLFVRNDGSFSASPRAVMNALYAAPLQSLLGTDRAGHCGSWGDWPNH